MTVQELMEMELFRTVNPGDDLERQITEPFCCDLLSVAMSRAPEGCAVSEGCGNRHKLSGCIPEQNFAAASVIGFRFVLIVRMACKHGVHPLKQGKIFLL